MDNIDIEFYTEEDIKNILKIGAKQCHALMNTEGFPSIQVGRTYRVLKSAFVEWVNSTKKIKLDYSKL